jgi:hypothetical protein
MSNAVLRIQREGTTVLRIVKAVNITQGVGGGSGDVTGPSSSVTQRIAVFNGTTGKAITQAAVTVADLQGATTTAQTTATNAASAAASAASAASAAQATATSASGAASAAQGDATQALANAATAQATANAAVPTAGHAATSVVGRAGSGTGVVADIAAGADDRLFARVGGALAFVQLTIGMIADGLITLSKLSSAVQNMLAKLGTAGSYKASIQTVSTASATISADTDEVLVTYTGGTCTLTLPTEANAPIGRTIVVRKANTSSNGITITPDSGSSIQGGATDASVSPSFFTTPSSTTEADQACMLTRTGSTTWRFA